MKTLELAKNLWVVICGLPLVILFANFPNAEGATVFFAEGKFTKDGIDWCEEEKPRFELIGQQKWLEQHNHSIEARIALNLFSDPLWTYEGSDRVQKLIERSAYYAELEISESKEEAKTGIVDPSPAEDKENTSKSKIPGWVRNIFLWYGQELISEDELLRALEYLIDVEILQVKK